MSVEQVEKRPLVGVGIAVVRAGKVLLGLRQGSFSSGTWTFPGGHLEFGESWEECARRETLEEAGLEICDVQHVSTTNDLYTDEDRHYITVGMMAGCDGAAVARVMEPDKCVEWRWFAPSELPENLFRSTSSMIRELRKQNLL